MNDGRVIDSSIGISWVYQDQATEDTKRLLLEREQGTECVVPLLWFTEIANGLLVLERRKKLTTTNRKIALGMLDHLNLTIDEESGRAAFRTTSDLAETHGLTVYDATYLEVALRRKLALASRDEQLCAAAKKCGVRVL